VRILSFGSHPQEIIPFPLPDGRVTFVPVLGKLVDLGMARATVLTMTDAEKKKKEYLELLAKTPGRALRLEGLSREIIQTARLAEDVTRPMGEVIANLPADQFSPEQWDQLIAGQRKWLENATRLEVSMAESARIFAAGSTVMSSTNTSAAFMITVSGLPQAAKIQAAQKELSRVLEQAPLVESARASMRRLGLDRRTGDRKSARELLDEAQTALDQPSGAAGGEVAVLLTLREAIEAALSELIRRRPVQEPTPNNREKIRSIGRHCALSALKDQFETLATDGHEIINTLSGVKQAALSRPELITLFRRGVLLLDALLKSVDETKLRQ
jgi:hypothetical protein